MQSTYKNFRLVVEPPKNGAGLDYTIFSGSHCVSVGYDLRAGMSEAMGMARRSVDYILSGQPVFNSEDKLIVRTT